MSGYVHQPVHDRAVSEPPPPQEIRIEYGLDRCIVCNKPLLETQTILTLMPPLPRKQYHLHETPCLGAVNDWAALSRKAERLEQAPQQASFLGAQT